MQSGKWRFKAISSIEWKCHWGNGGVKQLVQVYGNAIGEMEVERNKFNSMEKLSEKWRCKAIISIVWKWKC